MSRRAYVKQSMVGKISSKKREKAAAVMAQQRANLRSQVRFGGFASPSTSGELKFTDVGVTTSALGVASAAFTTPGPTFLLNGLVPDSTATGRIGRKVVMKSLLFRAELRLATTSTQGGYMRYIIVYDRQSNATAPAVTDILLADACTSPMNLSNKDRFQILAEGVSNVVSVNGDYCSSHIDVYKKLDHPVQFNAGVAGTIGDIQTGAVYVIFAQNGSIGTAAPSAVWRSRIRYSDN